MFSEPQCLGVSLSLDDVERSAEPVPREDAGERVPREYEVAGHDLAEHVAIVAGDREIESLVPLIDAQYWPSPEHLSALDAAANRHHRIAVAVVGAAVAVFRDRPPELRHRQDHGIGEAIPEI